MSSSASLPTTTSSRLRLSQQQKSICETLRPLSSAALKHNSLQDDDDDDGAAAGNKSPLSESEGSIVVVTAAAGTGKTTTLLELAKTAFRLGHSHITYLTFNRSAAADAKQKLQQCLYSSSDCPPTTTTTTTTYPRRIDCSTLHSSAMRLLNMIGSDDNESKLQLLDDGQMKKYILKTCRGEIQDFMSSCQKCIMSKRHITDTEKTKKLKNAEKQVVFFIYKTLQNFCRSKMSLKEFADKQTFNRVYYPAALYHASQKAEKAGFEQSAYNFPNILSFYADIVHDKLWPILCDETRTTPAGRPVTSYDVAMKRAQLQNVQIPGTVLLVDETQDCDACQMDWVTTQYEHVSQIYLVGDCAQTIYSFRGARSTCIMDVATRKTRPSAVFVEGATSSSSTRQPSNYPVMTRNLTTSWRFGPHIAKIANTVLFAKEKSLQTFGRKQTWMPYRVVGGRKYKPQEKEDEQKCLVTNHPFLPYWENHPVTLISFMNATLMCEAVALLGFAMQPHDNNYSNPEEEDEIVDSSDEDDHDNGDGKPFAPTVTPESQEEEQDQARYSNSDESQQPIDIANMKIPKFHVNGKGESSGMKKWGSTLQVIEDLHRLFVAQPNGIRLDADRFPDFEDDILTWESFCEQVEARELNQFVTPISVVRRFQNQTMEAVELFRRKVLEARYEAHEADIILTTCHAAKGMEWDRVQLCNDMWNICGIEPRKENTNNNYAKKRTKKVSNQNKWQFKAKEYGDDINLLYVACTRAKFALSVPNCIDELFKHADIIHRQCLRKKGVDRRLFGMETELSDEEVKSVHRDIVHGLRKEFGIAKDSDSLHQTALRPLLQHGQSSEDDNEDDQDDVYDDDACSDSSSLACNNNNNKKPTKLTRIVSQSPKRQSYFVTAGSKKKRLN